MSIYPSGAKSQGQESTYPDDQTFLATDANLISDKIEILEKNTTISINVPTEINSVTGDTIQIFYQALVDSPNYKNFHFVGQYSNFNEAKSTPRYLEITPTTTGTHTATFYVLGQNNEVIDQKTTNIIVTSSVSEPLKQVDFWNIGDSFINNPTSTNELIRRLTGAGGTPTGDGFSNISVHRIGNSGREWNWYVTSEDSPFVFSGVLDFDQYRLNQGFNVPKMVQINLTWNGVGDKKTDAEWDTWDNDVYTFIDTLKTQFPNVEVFIVSPSMPSTLGGESAINGARGLETYGDEYQLKVNCLRMAQIYERIKQEVGYEYVSHIQSALQVDSLYNVGFSDTNVNTRNANIQERLGIDDVHPTTEGYYQIADAQYRKFIAEYCQGGDVKGLSLTNTDRDSISFNRILNFNNGDWIEFEITTDNPSGDKRALGYSADTSNNIFWLTNTGVFIKLDDGTQIPMSGALDANTNKKIKLIKESGDYVVYVDGVEFGRFTSSANLFIDQINKRGNRADWSDDMIIKSYSLTGDYTDCQEGTGTVLSSYLNLQDTINTNKANPNTVWVNL